MKSSLVSIIITTKNEERHIENCLKSINRQSYKDIEVIIIDNNSEDKTKKIAKKYTEYVYDKGPERSAQRNEGARCAKGKWLLFLDADMILTKNVVKDSLSKAEEVGCKYIIIPEKSFGKTFWAKCKALERSYYVGLDWIEAPRFISKKAFLKVGGFDENNTGTEDFELTVKLKKTYGSDPTARVDSYIRHNEADLSLVKTMKKKFYYAKKLKRYKLKNADMFQRQASLLKRYKLYFSKKNNILNEPIIFFAMIFMKTLEFGAGGLGHYFFGENDAK